MKLTVRELAERVLTLSPESDLDGVIRQLRHWTLSGVLHPAEGLHTGAGRARTYGEFEVYMAALALELSKWRIPVGISDRLVKGIREHHALLDRIAAQAPGRDNQVRAAIEGQPNVYLLVQTADHRGDQPPVVRLGRFEDLFGSKAYEGRWFDQAPSFLGVNLSELFAKVRS